MNRYEFYGNINTYRKNQTNKENELTHYGTLGQKWGVRKWQNPDGTFNEAGKKRYFGKNGTTKKNTEEDKIGNKDIPTVADKLYPNKKYELNDKDYNKFQEITYDISSKMEENAKNNKGQKFRENQEKLEEELLKVPFVKKHFDEMKKIYQETGDWDKAEEHYWEIPDLAEQGDFLINTIQNHINDDQKIGASYKMSYQNEEEAEGKIGSSWKSMTDDDYAKVEKDMKKAGWDTEENRKPGVQVYSKPIDNDDYKGIKYEVDAYKFHDNSVDDINKKYQEHINFLNKKDSLKQVLDNFADYEYPYYEKYINNHNKYFDNKLDVISKAEFINAVKSNINLNKTGLSWNDELYMQFVPKENKDFNYFKDMYDVFTVDVDPKSGKVSDFTIV